MSATMPRTESVFEEFSDAKRKIQEVFEQIKEQIEAVQENCSNFYLNQNPAKVFSNKEQISDIHRTRRDDRHGSCVIVRYDRRAQRACRQSDWSA